jgi:hypothetical protein
VLVAHADGAKRARDADTLPERFEPGDEACSRRILRTDHASEIAEPVSGHPVTDRTRELFAQRSAGAAGSRAPPRTVA